jgi:Domain of unknown function (DUF4190)
MKVCPICKETYTDETLNFCLNDGGTLSLAKDDVPPTIFMNQPRPTNPNWTGYQPPTYQNQQMTRPQQFGIQGQNQYQNRMQDQTLPTISLILGILSIVLICCYGGLPLGLGAAITGFIGMNNANNNPMQYGGKGLSIAGLILGISSFLLTIIFIILGVLGSFI